MISNAMLLIVCLIVFFLTMKLVRYVYPIYNMELGKTVEIYVDNTYNRTATISHNLRDRVMIYDAIGLPVNYRGKFYAIGYTEDGHKLMFVGRKRLYFLACIAELIRKVSGTPEYADPTIENSEAGLSNPNDELEDEQ